MMHTAKMLLATAALLQLTTGWTAHAYAVPDDVTMISNDVTWIRKEVDDKEVTWVRRDLDFEEDPEDMRAGTVISLSNGIQPVGLSYKDIRPASGSALRALITVGKGKTVVVPNPEPFGNWNITYQYQTTAGSTLKLSCSNYKSDDFNILITKGGFKSFTAESSSVEFTSTSNELSFLFENWSWEGYLKMKCTVTASGATEPPVTGDCTCGIANKGSRIIGGSKAAPREFPWIVQVVTTTNSGRYGCGGTIISPQHIVTAAHCTKFKDMVTQKVQVIYGVDNLASATAAQRLDVETVYDHPSYDPFKYPQDITVLKLKNKLTFDKNVSPACLPDPGTDYAEKAAIVAGWGKTSDPNGSSSNDLLKVDMTFGSNAYCKARISVWEEQYMICTKYTPGKDSCQGDSGGPVMVEMNGKYQLVGAVSFGPHPCATEGPGTNTRITAYLSWINGILSENGDAACE